MRKAQLAVLFLFLIAISAIGWALLSTPGFRGEFSASPVQTIVIFVIGAAFCGWPWLLSYSAAAHIENDLPAIIFSVVGLGIAGLFVRPIASAPAEGVGLNLVFCVLLIWLAYAMTPRFDWPK